MFGSELRYLRPVSYIRAEQQSGHQSTLLSVNIRWPRCTDGQRLYCDHVLSGLRSKDIQHLFPRPQNSISRVRASACRSRFLSAKEVSSRCPRKRLLFATPKGTELLAEIKAKVLFPQNEMLGSLTIATRRNFS